MFNKKTVIINKIRKAVCLGLSFVMISGAVSFAGNEVDVYSATYEDINSSDVFLKQKGSDTCTLVSTVMMIRRALIMKGNSKWKNATESSVKSVAWNDGLAWNFTYMGISVGHESLPASSEAKKQLLISLLKEHPEGIVLYYQGSVKMHAVLLTEYTNGKFYCAEPAGQETGVIPLSHAFYVTASNATSYWYVKDSLPALTSFVQSEASLSIASSNINDKLVDSASNSNITQVLTFANSNSSLLPDNYKKLRVGVTLASKKKGVLNISWDKKENITGYKIQYSTKAGFSKYKERRVSASKNSLKIKKLKSNKKYYVRVCAYKKLDNGSYLHYRYSQKKNIIVK